jgi:hypothetical protein
MPATSATFVPPLGTNGTHAESEKGINVTPIFIAPPELPPPPRVANAVIVKGIASNASAATISASVYVPYTVPLVGEPDWPSGIEYDKWAPVVQPSPRQAFADRLDIVELFGDE